MDFNQKNSENFSLSEGALVRKALIKMHLDKHRWKFVFLILMLTWLPQVILTAIEGTLYSGVGLPFLLDVGMQVRVLVVIPILILINESVYKKVASVLRYVSEVLIRAEDKDFFINSALRTAKKYSNSTLAEILIILLVISFSFILSQGNFIYGVHGTNGSWLVNGMPGNQTFTKAGLWTVFVSLPVFQFLLIRWLWRYFVWVQLVFRISRMNLKLHPTHPDRSGGLGIIMSVQRNFGNIFVAIGFIISAELIAILNDSASSIESTETEIIGFIIFSLILIFSPLLFFTSSLIRAKNNGYIGLSKAATKLSLKFESDWVAPLQLEDSVSQSPVDPSIHYDYSGIFHDFQNFRIVPMTINDLLPSAFLLFIPFIPLLFIQYSIAELLLKIIGLLV